MSDPRPSTVISHLNREGDYADNRRAFQRSNNQETGYIGRKDGSLVYYYHSSIAASRGVISKPHGRIRSLFTVLELTRSMQIRQTARRRTQSPAARPFADHRHHSPQPAAEEAAVSHHHHRTSPKQAPGEAAGQTS